MRIAIIAALLALSACSIDPSKDRLFDPDEEFAKLDGPNVPTVQQSLERGAIEALAAGNLKRAAGLYDQLIDQNPQELRYQFGMAEALRRLGEFKAAVTLYERVTRANPQHLDAMEGLALAKMALGDTEPAARILQRVLERDRRRWRTLNALGILFAIKELTRESEAYLDEALRVSKDNPSVLNNLGLIQAMQRNYRGSLETLKKASRQTDEGPQREQIDLNRALVSGISGDLKQAERLASEHLDDGALQNNLGLYAYLANNRELAKSYLNMALTGTELHYKRAWENLDIIAEEEPSPPSRKGKRVKVN